MHVTIQAMSILVMLVKSHSISLFYFPIKVLVFVFTCLLNLIYLIWLSLCLLFFHLFLLYNSYSFKGHSGNTSSFGDIG